MVTKLLEQAFTEAAKLSEDDQRALAEWILEELQSERRWQESFAASQGELSHLAEEAQAELRAGAARRWTSGETRFEPLVTPAAPMIDTKNEDLTPCLWGLT